MNIQYDLITLTIMNSFRVHDALYYEDKHGPFVYHMNIINNNNDNNSDSLITRKVYWDEIYQQVIVHLHQSHLHQQLKL